MDAMYSIVIVFQCVSRIWFKCLNIPDAGGTTIALYFLSVPAVMLLIFVCTAHL